jgi:nickel-type superoxide dismutase maturation protease
VRWPWWRVAVSGASMTPTLADGDWLVCRRLRRSSVARLHPGQVVVVERPDRPGLLVVKRLVRRTPDGWWVEGDNPDASDDSRTFGAVADACVLARVRVRYAPRPRLL